MKIIAALRTAMCNTGEQILEPKYSNIGAKYSNNGTEIFKHWNTNIPILEHKYETIVAAGAAQVQHRST